MVLEAKANDRRKNLAPSPDEFRGPRSDIVRQAETVLSQAKCFQWDNITDIERYVSWKVASLTNESSLSLPRFPLWSPTFQLDRRIGFSQWTRLCLLKQMIRYVSKRRMYLHWKHLMMLNTFATAAGWRVISSLVPLKTHRVKERCRLNLSRAQTSSRWCGVVVRRGGASSGVVLVT
ncbi:hypothetical protein TNCV_1690951 [Trichonephila clavipes]|nr:hypothetical protein TNCV_1690951 [Trichonephila clavipes]